MTIYIALLPGINVGGKNIIKMAELRSSFEELGLSDVKTYIQSGNIIFKSREDEKSLREKIEYKIKEVFKISLTVILRTAKELEQIIYNCPFSEEEILEAEEESERESLYVAFLLHGPSQDKIEYLNNYRGERDKHHIEGRQVFLLFYNSIRNSKLARNLQKLDVPLTTRNWKTISKLYALTRDMED